MRLIRPLLRVMSTVVAILAVLLVAIGVTLRQPTVGRTPLPYGPRADPAQLRAHVEYLTVDAAPRGWRQAGNLTAVAEYIEGELVAAGAKVRRQRYSTNGTEQQNVVGRLGGDRHRDPGNAVPRDDRLLHRHCVPQEPQLPSGHGHRRYPRLRAHGAGRRRRPRRGAHASAARHGCGADRARPGSARRRSPARRAAARRWPRSGDRQDRGGGPRAVRRGSQPRR